MGQLVRLPYLSHYSLKVHVQLSWVKVKNFQNLELFETQILKLAVCPLNIHNFKFKWPIVFRETVYK